MPVVSIEKAKAVISDFVLIDKETSLDELTLGSEKYIKFVNEFWTAKQRQANSIHEISYRACYKPQLPRFFIDIFTKEGDVVYDPFAGRGTTLIEAALLNRKVVSNDVNPLSRLLVEPRLNIPTIDEVEDRLDSINIEKSKADIDLSMFILSNLSSTSSIVGIFNLGSTRRRLKGLTSLLTTLRFSNAASISVVPRPANGSYTTSPSLVNISMKKRGSCGL
jgi:hypothetical protein